LNRHRLTFAELIDDLYSHDLYFKTLLTQ
jgi:hypothetical protein